MYKKILDSQSNGVGSAAIILAVTSFISAIFALFRDRLLAATFGAGDVLDAYYTAFRIPDFVAMVLVMGAISAAIIPIFSSYSVRSKKEAFDFLGNLINVFLIGLVLISAILIIFVPQILSLIAPGFAGEKKELAVFLTRIMFLSPILLGVSNIISGVLRVFKRFLVTSLAPIFYNLGIILGILIFVPLFGAKGLAFGVVLGALLHLLLQLPILFKLGFKPLRKIKIFDAGVLKTINLTIPRAFGLAAGQINLIVITAIGSTLAPGSIAVFNLAYNLRNLPVNLIAISLCTAAFPFMSLSFSEGKKEELARRFLSVFRQIIFLLAPISLLIFLLRAQIIRIILGAGEFGWVDTRLTAASLGIFSFGIAAYGLSLLVNKTFYALHDTKIPALVTVFAIAINIFLSYLFVWILSFKNFFQQNLIDFLDLQGINQNAVVGLPLALAISGIIQFLVLFFIILKRLEEINFKSILIFALKILLACFTLALVCLIFIKILAGVVNMQTFWGIFWQTTASAGAGLGGYLAIALIFKVGEIKTIKNILFGRVKI